jgi:hypothetical protein
VQYRYDILKVNPLAALAACALLAGLVSGAPAQVKPNHNLEQFNTIRMARLPVIASFLYEPARHGMVDSALRRYRDAGYNYVLMYADIIDTTDPAKDSDAEVENYLRWVVRRASLYGLRVIPQLSIGAVHSSAWMNMSGRIQMNRTLCHGCNPFDRISDNIDASPSFAADPMGIDTNLARTLQYIRRVFADSVVRYPLEYISLGYDEFANTYSKDYAPTNIVLYPIGAGAMLYAGKRNDMSHPFTMPGGAVPGRQVSRAKVDSQFIANSGAATTSEAVQRLVVNSLYRRVGQVKTHLGPDVKTLIYVDVFDAEFFGKVAFRAFNLDTVSFSGTLTTLPGLTAPQADFLRANLFVMPWNYAASEPLGTSYNAGKAFSQFTSSGFKILYGVAIGDPNGDTAIANSGIRAMKNYVDSSKSFKGSVLGYAAQWYPYSNFSAQGDISAPTGAYVRARDLFPRASMRVDQTSTTTLLLFR